MPDLKVLAKELEGLENIRADKMAALHKLQDEFAAANRAAIDKHRELHAARQSALRMPPHETPPPSVKE